MSTLEGATSHPRRRATESINKGKTWHCHLFGPWLGDLMAYASQNAFADTE